MTSTVRISHPAPDAAAVTNVKVPDHLATLQIRTQDNVAARAETLKATADPLAPPASVPSVPVRPLPAPVPVPVVPANAPTAPGATGSITSALADVRKRGDASGDTVTQEPANSAPLAARSLGATETFAAGAVETRGAAEATASSMAQEVDDVPRRLSVRSAGDALPAPDPGASSARAAEFRAAKTKIETDKTTLKQKQQTLETEKQQFQAAVDQYNKDATALNTENGPIQQENAALTAAITAHNATSWLFKVWPLNGPYNAEGAALATRQAAFNARVIAHNLAKTQLDARALTIKSQEASINARTLQNLAEGMQLAQSDQDLSNNIANEARSIHRAALDAQEWAKGEQNLANIAAQHGVPADQLPRTSQYSLDLPQFTEKLDAAHAPEVTRQADLWQHGFNTQTVQQALDNTTNPRPVTTELRNKLRDELEIRAQNDLVGAGYGVAEAAKLAQDYALQQFPKESGLIPQPVLHNPDMAIGGSPDAYTYGDWQVNNALATLTKQEKDAFIAWLKTQDPNAVLNVKLERPATNA
ncbi:Uncharacterised protein [Mycolicibacterium phlei]|uniref:hypothetical protein n=1 Tax=Mycobacteroides chelonae TaxID=1774 RepID=UPI00069779E7|nr:hypothetical protein [Mycobacteroides chelonae]ANB00269.1 hypothetical protein BB28_22170 [Mycobacteroides chelonae CCUG 47445]OLT81981.1 hypothetical protein BKG56_07550 [Mycobacteroides chelonae]ORV14194.1 hypothetical protein AWB96_12330 [Mycobacteroides chelonae]VEG20213.1 Uncharacterised protein [Mycolicibacterium phlei]